MGYKEPQRPEPMEETDSRENVNMYGVWCVCVCMVLCGVICDGYSIIIDVYNRSPKI